MRSRAGSARPSPRRFAIVIKPGVQALTPRSRPEVGRGAHRVLDGPRAASRSGVQVSARACGQSEACEQTIRPTRATCELPARLVARLPRPAQPFTRLRGHERPPGWSRGPGHSASGQLAQSTRSAARQALDSGMGTEGPCRRWTDARATAVCGFRLVASSARARRARVIQNARATHPAQSCSLSAAMERARACSSAGARRWLSRIGAWPSRCRSRRSAESLLEGLDGLEKSA